MDPLSLLKHAELPAGSIEQLLVSVTLRWLATDSTARTDPLLSDVLSKIHLQASVQPTLVPAPAQPTRKVGIMSYFSGGGSAASATIPTRYRIYCDGACSANGRRGAKAGYGAILQDPTGKEVEAISIPLESTEPQTNQRAELRALQWAFTKARDLSEGVDIYTDSEYAIKCFSEWGATWASRGWRKADGKDVLHQDILKPMWEMWKYRGTLRLHHVSAHTGRMDPHSIGNARADSLAVASLRI